MIIDDLIVLGTAVPEQIKSGRKTVCLGGFSPKHGFIRVYPCRADMGLKRWQIIEVEVERNPQDTRHESWKFPNSKDEWVELNKYLNIQGKVKRSEREGLMRDVSSKGVSVINDKLNSLGIVQPTQIHKAYFDKNPQKKKKPKQELLLPYPNEGWVTTKHQFRHVPRVEYSCEVTTTKTGKHNHQVIEWGAYMWMFKNPNKINQYWENVRIFDDDYSVFFFVGNQANYRTSFLVINIITMKTNKGNESQRQLRLFA